MLEISTYKDRRANLRTDATATQRMMSRKPSSEDQSLTTLTTVATAASREKQEKGPKQTLQHSEERKEAIPSAAER